MNTMTKEKKMATKQEVISQYEKYVVPCYRKNGIVLVKGKGSVVWDADGKEYLDLYPGWGVAALGHAPEAVASALAEQAKLLLHVPNNYFHPLQGKLAQKLVELSFPSKCFFGNSGAEANEGAIKLARLRGSKEGRYEIISFYNAFHGRTLAALAATAQPKYQHGFEPMPAGFVYAEFNNLESVKKGLTPKTAGIMLEPVQGEGGVYPATKEFLKGLRALCDEKKITLIFDEVQTGVGRTGEMFACKTYGIYPDVMTLAKGLGGGLPIGAFLAKPELADLMQPGTHASTFGGSPIVCAAALTVLDAIEKKGLLAHVKKNGAAILKKLEEMKKRCSVIREVRGLGFLIGVELTVDPLPVIEKCAGQGVLVNRAGDKVIRLLPALNIEPAQWEKGLAVLESVLKHA